MTTQIEDGLRQRLRTETKELHARTEAKSPLMILFRGQPWNDKIEESYNTNLIAQGNLIELVRSNESEWKGKTNSLSELYNCIPPLMLDLKGVTETLHKPNLDLNQGQAIGVGYVLLGSSMGSQVILDKIGEKIPEHKRAFMVAMAEVSVAFRKFCVELDEIEPEMHDSVVEGAKKAFLYLESMS